MRSVSPSNGRAHFRLWLFAFIVGLLALLPGQAALAAGVTFSSATNYAVGSTPFFVAAGDFNGDGKLDFATANVGSNNVSVRLGTGTGGFGAVTNFPAGSGAVHVAVGDLNGDGKLDLVTSNHTGNNVSVLLGTGAGAFGPASNFAVGAQPRSAAVGDFDGDGKLDLAVANRDSNNVSILLGNGGGGFSAATNIAVGSEPMVMTVGDFNGDGKLDFATANRGSNNVSVRLGTGTGGFGALANFAVGTDPRQVAVGDFNADGKQDLATANAGSGNVSVLLGTGAGAFGPATNFATASDPVSVEVGDFDGDGKQDLAAVKFSSGVSVLPGNGAGSFGAAANFAVGSGPHGIAVSDFNADGKPDLAASNIGSNNVTVLLNGTPAPDTTAPVVTPPANVTATATGPSGAVVTYPNATATDNVGVTSGPTCTPASGSTFPIGTTAVNCSATDAAGNTGSASFTVTVPTASVCAPNVAEASQYSLVYELVIPVSSNYSSTPPAYSVNNSASTGSFNRIAYCLQLDGNWVWVSMDAFTTVPSRTGVPVLSTGATFQQTVSNMNVASNVPGVVSGTGITSGNIEFWPTNYSTANFASIPGASGSTYDFGDQKNPGTYGSMQVHNYGAGQTIFSYNRWGGTSGNSDLGIGNSPVGNPDWTFRTNANNYSVRNLKVYVGQVQADNTPPVITASITAGTLGDNGWYTSAVTVGFSCTDTLSGVAFTPGSVTLSADGMGQEASGTCVDNAGNSADASVSAINIDQTAPAAAISISPAAPDGSNGWYITHPTVSFSGSDATSGVAGCTGDAVLGDGVAQSATGTCTDNAGNVSAPVTSTPVSVDTTKPGIAITGVTDDGSYTLGAVPAAGFSCADGLSGVASSSDSLTGGNSNWVGTFTYSVMCTDAAGKTQTTSVSYSVGYAFGGFLPPLEKKAVFKGGSTIPVKFTLKDANGVSVSTAVAQVYANGVLVGTAKYDAQAQQYVFTLSTKGLPTGSLTITVQLDDGTSQSINVTLR